MHNYKSHQPKPRPTHSAQPSPQESIRSTFKAVSAEEYEKFRQRIIAQEQIMAQQKGIGLASSDSQCKAIEVMCSGISVALLEVFVGRRPVQHISKWMSRDCQQKVVLRSKLTAQTLRKKYMQSPLNHSPFASNIALPKARRVKAQKVSDSAFEVCLVMQDYSRTRAIAMRVEKVFTAWKITEIEIA